MIVNEIAKFENPPQARVELLLVAHLREEALVLVLDLLRSPSLNAYLPSSAGRPRAIKGVPARPMDDATLSPVTGRVSSGPMPIWAGSSDRLLGGAWAARTASPSRSTAGSPTATTARASAARDYVIRVPGKDTDAAGHRPRRRARRERARGRARDRAAGARRCSTTRPAS